MISSRDKKIILWIAGLIASSAAVWMTWPKPDHIHVVGYNMFQSVSAVFATVLLFIAHRRRKEHNTSYWLYYALGCLCYSAAQTYYTGYLGWMAEEPSFGMTEAVWVLQYVFFMMALGNQIKFARARYSTVRYVLDILLITAAFLSLGWYYLVDVGSAKIDHAYEHIWFYLFCTTANAMVLIGLAILSLYERRAAPNKGNLLLMIGFSIKTIANIYFLYLLREGIEPGFFSVADLLWCIAMLPIGLSILHQREGVVFEKTANLCGNILRQWLPYLLITLMFVVILLGFEKINMLVMGSVISVYLLITRLLLSIYEHQRSDYALQETESKYRSLVENSQAGVFLEQQGKLTYVNRSCADIFGSSPEAMLGRPMSDFLIPSDQEIYKRSLLDLQRPPHTLRLELKGVKPSGTVYLEIQANQFENDGKQAISGTLLDTTERHVSEELLRKSEKLSVVGQLAAGVAHEIRNPLTALRGFTQLLKSRADDNKYYYEIMLTELERINYIVGEFMLLAKPQQLQQLKPHDMRQILGDIIPIIESHSILNNVEIQIDWGVDLDSPQVICDENQMKQVFINLLKNAIEAMTDGGQIKIRFIRSSTNVLCISIEDQGPGIPQELLTRLGEPFFSTKPNGTGLGLMVCYRIIEAHHGTLEIRSNPGQGTIAEILLPVDFNS
jgi:two-component system, sporulation sensor kinase A